MKLDSETIPVASLPAALLDPMCRLMQEHYDGVTRFRFEEDLRSKSWVILLRHEGELCGFSTQRLFDFECQGRQVKILFSGDTIIEKRFWGSFALPVTWGRLMLSILADSPSQNLYWLLTTKGYKTYRFLPVFFRGFHPCYSSEPSAFERALLQEASRHCFGERFDIRTGLLNAGPGSQRLRQGIAELEERRLRDPHIAFFLKRNPCHALGDELVCLARFHPDNLHEYIYRQLIA